MAKLRLTFACWSYDRTGALASGSVAPEGIDLNYLDLSVEETFFRMLRHREFDVAEMSLSSYCVSLAARRSAVHRDPGVSVAHVPAFVHLRFGEERHPRAEGPRRQDASATPEYQMTAPVWIRGILQDEYGVDPASVRVPDRRRGRSPAATRKLKLDLPAQIQGAAHRAAGRRWRR